MWRALGIFAAVLVVAFLVLAVPDKLWPREDDGVQAVTEDAKNFIADQAVDAQNKMDRNSYKRPDGSVDIDAYDRSRNPIADDVARARNVGMAKIVRAGGEIPHKRRPVVNPNSGVWQTMGPVFEAVRVRIPASETMKLLGSNPQIESGPTGITMRQLEPDLKLDGSRVPDKYKMDQTAIIEDLLRHRGVDLNIVKTNWLSHECNDEGICNDVIEDQSGRQYHLENTGMLLELSGRHCRVPNDCTEAAPIGSDSAVCANILGGDFQAVVNNRTRIGNHELGEAFTNWLAPVVTDETGQQQRGWELEITPNDPEATAACRRHPDKDIVKLPDTQTTRGLLVNASNN